MKCSEIMIHEVKSVKVTDDAFFAARLMREHAIGFLPVHDEHGRVVGVVTDRDLAMKVVGGDHAAVDTAIGDVMSKPVISCRPAEAVSHAEREMDVHGVRRIVVVDGKGHAVGVVSRTDLPAKAVRSPPA